MKPVKKYNKKFFGSFLGKVTVRLLRYPSLFCDWTIDRKICKCSLVKTVPSLYRESKGATSSQSTSYAFLNHMFESLPLKDSDVFLDVGCGKGRVLAFLINKGFKGSINGIELNPEVASYAKSWSSRYNNVNVECGDAFLIDYNKYTVLYLNRPFETVFFERFINHLEKHLTHTIKILYYVDQQSGKYLSNRVGWLMKKREWIFNTGPIFHSLYPQAYSIWEYTPQNVF